MQVRYPFVKITILFTTGILLHNLLVVPFWTLFLVFAAGLLVYFIVKPGVIKNFSVSFIVLLLILLCGYFTAKNRFESYSFFPNGIYKQNDISLYGNAGSVSLKNHKGFTFEFMADSSYINGLGFHKQVHLIVNVKRENLGDDFNSFYESIHPGDYLRITGLFIKGREMRNPGEFDYNNFLYYKGISGVIHVLNKENVKTLRNSDDSFNIWMQRIREGIAGKINMLHDRETASLLKGLILADRSDIDENVKDEFINSGVVHVLAVSGLHVGFIILIIVLLCGRLNLILRILIITAGILFYILLTGAPASVVRAGLMSVIILLAFLSNRNTKLINSIALSAFFILLLKPEELFSTGFQLSYAAVLSIALVYPVLTENEFIKKIKSTFLKRLSLFIVLTLSAQIGTLPFILLYFGKISVTSLFANLLVIPISGLLLGNGILSVLLSYIYLPIAVYPSITSEIIRKIIYFLVNSMGGEYSYIPVYRFGWINLILFYCLLGIFIFWFPRFNSHKAKAILLILLFLNILVTSRINENRFVKENELTIAALDVGQGDSFMVYFPNGKTALIDAGEASLNYDTGDKVVLPFMNYFNVHLIDYAFISHMDKDHYSGMLSLIHKGKVKKVFKPAPGVNDSLSIKFDSFCRSNKVSIQYYSKTLLTIGNTKIYMLNDKCFNNDNDNSGLFKMVYGKSSILFTGDISKKGEKYYEKYGAFLRSSVLKVSHHGSRTATSEDFINVVKPSFSIISAGIQNRYRHPAPEVIQRLNKVNSEILRIDISGAQLMRSDGERFTLINWR